MNKKMMLFIMLLFFSINVFAKGEATLKNLKINNIPCKCAGYDCSVEVDATMATITYDLVDSEAKVDRLSGFNIELLSQVTMVKVTVSNTVNEEKIENTYNISITKHEKSNDFTLKSLKVNGDSIELLEDIYVFNYTCEYNKTKINIDVVPNDSHAKVIKENEYDFPIDAGSVSIDFSIEAENKERKTFRIFVTRGVKPDTTLKSLKIDHGNINFDKDTFHYEFNVDYSVNDLKIEAVPMNKNAKVEIKKDTLVVGENEIKIIVTNDKNKSEYVLVVTRDPNYDKSLANLAKLEVDEYPKLNFEENVLDYVLKFSKIPDKLNIHAKAKDENSKITILHNEDLKNGSKVIVKVTLNDSNISREYSLEMKEQKGISNNKKIILVCIVILITVIAILLILEIKDKKKQKKKYLNKIFELRRKKEKKKKEEIKTKEEDIEII